LILREDFDDFSGKHIIDAFPMSTSWMQNLVNYAVEFIGRVIEEEKPKMIFVV